MLSARDLSGEHLWQGLPSASRASNSSPPVTWVNLQETTVVPLEYGKFMEIPVDLPIIQSWKEPLNHNNPRRQAMVIWFTLSWFFRNPNDFLFGFGGCGDYDAP
jgi:hypothetical protein